MKINFDQKLIGVEGKPLLVEAPSEQFPEGKAWTLRDAIITSIRTALPGDDALDPLKKFELGAIGMAMFKGLDITVEQVGIVKDRIGKAFLGGEAVYAAWVCIEGENAPADAPVANPPES